MCMSQLILGHSHWRATTKSGVQAFSFSSPSGWRKGEA